VLQKDAGLSQQTGVIQDGVLHCNFNRKKQYPKDPRVFDLTKEYFLMVAVGEALNGILIISQDIFCNFIFVSILFF
jgi:hypothetical protein